MAGYTRGMSFDALTLAAVRDELENTLLGGQVQRVVLGGRWTLGLEVYAHRQQRFLLCSAEPLRARVCLAEDRPVRDLDTPTPFLLLLRKHVRHGRIVAVRQPPYERVLTLQIAKRAEGVTGEVRLIIETMGRRSNVVLIGPDGLILDALRRTGPGRNPRRPVLPHQPYAAPPAQDRLDPLDEASYARLGAEPASTPEAALEDVLAGRLAGFSPLAAAEAAFRAEGRLGARAAEANWAAVRAAVFGLLEPLSSHRWEPSVSFEAGRVTAFAPYRLTHLVGGDIQTLPSISRAVELGMAAGAPGPPVPAANRALLATIDELRQQAERKRAALERSLRAADEAVILQQAGEAVLANLGAIQPRQEALSFNGQQIPLDPHLSPLENAQRLFREYRKARDAAKRVPALLGATDLRLRHLEQLRALAEVADTPGRQAELRAELAALEGQADLEIRRGGDPARKQTASPRRKPSTPDGLVLRSRTPDGLEVLVGTSGRGNEAVTFKLAEGSDLWLHARGVPGAHVILRTAGREPPPESLVFAARLAARNSQARTAGRAEVDYTLRKHVRKIPGAPPGLVTYGGEKTLSVSIEA